MSSEVDYCSQKNKYNKDGESVFQTYLATKDKPVNCTSGFSTIKYKKDKDENTI